MEELSNGEKVLSGNYIQSSKIKQCNNCNCLSPIRTETCCWCGSNDLKTLIGNEEVEKEQGKLKEAQNQDISKTSIGVLLIIASIPLLISTSTNTFGIILCVVGCILIAMVKADKTDGHPNLAVKYSNINEFLSYISKKLSLQRSFTKASEDKEHLAIKSKLNNDFNTQISKQEFISLLDIWFDAYISPEVIKTRVNKYLKENNYKNYSKINSITNDYYEENKKVSKQIREGLTQTYKIESEQMSNIQTPGLDYGIITSSVSNAMLYSAMNNREKKNQYNRQLTPILRNTNRNLNYLVTSQLNSIDTNYNNYKNQIRKYVVEKVNEQM